MTLYNVMAPLIVSRFLDGQQVGRLGMTCKLLSSAIPKILHWSRLDYVSLREPRLDYNNLMTIEEARGYGKCSNGTF